MRIAQHIERKFLWIITPKTKIGAGICLDERKIRPKIYPFP